MCSEKQRELDSGSIGLELDGIFGIFWKYNSPRTLSAKVAHWWDSIMWPLLTGKYQVIQWEQCCIEAL